jgi:hypothetical protein
MNAKTIYVQYGCGLSAPGGWLNFDNSPTLRLQRLPLLGEVFRQAIKPRFPDAVRVGDIVTGLPISRNAATVSFGASKPATHRRFKTSHHVGGIGRKNPLVRTCWQGVMIRS